jgi:hypothetical protein
MGWPVPVVMERTWTGSPDTDDAGALSAKHDLAERVEDVLDTEDHNAMIMR